MKKVFCLMGPTASGKTDLAAELVQKFPFDVISVDSAMVYRGLDVGSAKPTAEELKITPHRLIDICDVAQPYSAADFCRDAKREIENIFAAGKIPLLVGGTMLYFRALQFGLSDLPAADEKIRAKLSQQIEQHGVESLHQKLRQVDPEAAKTIDQNNQQRLIRALEVFEITGTPMSQLQKQNAPEKPEYDFVSFALVPDDRAVLHDRIEKRFQQMLKLGFVDEVKTFYDREDTHLDLPSMRAVGYRQVWEYLDGKYDYDTMIEKSLAATRQLAKRQLTWLRGWPGEVFVCGDGCEIVGFVREQIRSLGI